jgi:hypothetical protein
LETLYDWLTLGVFAALVLLFLQRSAAPEEASDRIWHYLLPAAGCGAANYFGNNGNDLLAIAILIGVVAYIFFVLRPFPVPR